MLPACALLFCSSTTKNAQAGGMCSCCKNMAMMKGGGMMGGHKDMPGMNMPKQ